MKAAPALAAGNSLITKASEINPFSTLYLAELALEAGIPPGVLNVIVGTIPAGSALSSHMRIRKISFTGSAAVGRKVQIAAAQSNLKRVTLELGGKSPVLVFDDADIDNAVQNAMAFVALNGQGCVLGTRIYVQEGIADVFVEKLKAATEQFAATLGSDPFDVSTPSSPLFHHRQKETVVKFLEIGKRDATLVTGGDTWRGEKGCYIQPTVFLRPKRDSDIVRKEIFGPVAVVDVFKTEEEVLQLANDTEYGLGGSVYTKSLDRAMRVSHALEAGSIGVNTAALVHITIPFSGWKGGLLFCKFVNIFTNGFVQKAVSVPKTRNTCFDSSRKPSQSRSSKNFPSSAGSSSGFLLTLLDTTKLLDGWCNTQYDRFYHEQVLTTRWHSMTEECRG